MQVFSVNAAGKAPDLGQMSLLAESVEGSRHRLPGGRCRPLKAACCRLELWEPLLSGLEEARRVRRAIAEQFLPKVQKGSCDLGRETPPLPGV